MGRNAFVRLFALTALALMLAVAIAGCGGDDDGSETGAGAPYGATGDAAGGAAPEAGKQRTPEQAAEEKKYSSQPPPIQIQLGDRSDYSVSKPTIEVINSQSELNALIKKSGLKRKDFAPTDFKTRQVTLLQMPKSPAGTQMQIQDIQEVGGKMQVTAVKLTPGDNCPKGKGKIAPYDFVETAKLSGTPTLKLNVQQSSPCV